MVLFLGALQQRKLLSKPSRNAQQCLGILTLGRLLLITDLNFPNCDLITPSPKQNEHAEQIIPFLFTETFYVTTDYYVFPKSSLD